MFQKMLKTTKGEVIIQIKNWFSTFGVTRLIRADNEPPFSSKEFKEFCTDFFFGLNLMAPYNPQSLGAAERGNQDEDPGGGDQL